MGFRDSKAGRVESAVIRDPAAQQVSRHAASVATEVINWLAPSVPRGIARVPTHTVGRACERRAYVRARLSLPLCIQRVAGQREAAQPSLRTRDISSSGVYFFSREWIEPGTPVDLEVLLVDRPFGRGSVRMCASARIVRAEQKTKNGWHGLAATFDDITFRRDEPIPLR